MKLKSAILLGLIICIFSCTFFKNEPEGIPVARVNNNYLYKQELKNITSEEITKEDSILRVNNYINQWATQQLLIEGAKINLSEEKQETFNKLAEQYKNDLYIKAYQEALVKQNIDTLVTKNQALEVYNNNKTRFKLNEELIKFRYINVSETNDYIKEINEHFKRFNNKDKNILDSISIQFKSYSLNDSVWIRADQAINKIPVLNLQNKAQLLKKSNFIQLKDSLGVYLMQINDVLLRNDIAPIEYVMPTIKQIVINKRKLEFIKQLETDITKDAIKDNVFEIY